MFRTDSRNRDFHQLITLLDDELRLRDGEDFPFFAQFNNLDNIHHVIVAYQNSTNSTPVGCGAFRRYDDDTAEIKRMFVVHPHRGQGIATLILAALEIWACESGTAACILETGFNQPEAIALYKKAGYKVISNYGPYENVSTSVCMKKELTRPIAGGCDYI